MGRLNNIFRSGQQWIGDRRFEAAHGPVNRHHICRFEEIEPRYLMTADLHVGSVYYEQALGDDAQPNLLQFTFEGGAAGSQLTQIVIDGDKDGQGLSNGDVFFDTAPGGLGSFGSNPLKIVAHEGFQVLSTQVVDGGTRLIINLSGFDAGETLLLSIDVDEAQFVGSTPGDIDTNAVVEGGEFQRAHFTATFVAPNYEDITATTLFWDAYDNNFAAIEANTGSRLRLPADRYLADNDLSDLTAGAVASARQVPLPDSIAGVVFADANLNNHQDTGESGIGGVTLSLYLFNGSAYVATGATAVTDANGQYKFDNLLPGQYRVAEAQPVGYFSVGASAGTVAGQVRGVVTSPDLLSDITLLGGEDSVHNDFAESLPNSITGHVRNDVTGDCETNPDTPGIAGVLMRLLDANGETVRITITDANGNYRFDNLTAGTYTIVEEQPVGWLEGDNHVGSAGGELNGPDRVTKVTLTSNVNGVHYDFCELLPVSISGYVHVDTTGDCENTLSAPPLAGVAIQLLDATGQVIGTTQTNANGQYVFDNLRPGTYGVHELQPSGYFDGDEHLGSAGGTLSDDRVTNIVLLSGARGLHYDFCEIPPAQLCGVVYVDANNNGQRDAGEVGIAGVKLILRDARGNPTGATATTDATGFYCFIGLQPGTYGISEIQPAGYLDGLDSPGTAGGTAANPGDTILGAVLTPGFDAEDYNFGELLAATIRGNVHVRNGDNCDLEHGATPLAGVVVHLLNANGTIIATTTTNAAGAYQFNGLPPGSYSVLEETPADFFDGDADVGSAGGVAVSGNLIAQVLLPSGTQAVDYDFCEIPPASLSGFVFQDGPPISVPNPGEVPNVLALRDGILTSDDTRLPGVVLQLRDGVTGRPILGSAALPGFYAPDQPITVITDAQGRYSFNGLPPGVYGVFDVQPEGYLTGIVTPGSLGGIVISTLVVTDPAVLALLSAPPQNAAIVQITLGAGYASIGNNFSVVTTVTPPPEVQVFVFPQAPMFPVGVGPAPFLPPAQVALSPPLASVPLYLAPYIRREGGSFYTWHLSVVDAGQPRGLPETDAPVQLTAMRPSDELLWQDDDLTEGEWTLATDLDDAAPNSRKVRFGIRGGIPVTGDFNGDGKSDVGFFKDGEWFIDLNDNGIWDAGDLRAKLGHKGDRPVTGDWDGDGKTDIGIYGPAWAGDPRAVLHEPGLPDSHNKTTGVQKNMPREPHHMSQGERTMKLTATGKTRADLIDHVFFYGLPGDHPTVGDWNGDGTDTIAVFRSGKWFRDIDGDGKWTKTDLRDQFGRQGDVPVVGDFNGDGVDELGIFRDGLWYIDTNGNGAIDSEDQVFKLGGPGDVPVVGDWDGDGKSEPGVYHPAAAHTARSDGK